MRRAARPEVRPEQRRAYVLIAVLIVVVVLSLAAYRFTDAMTAEYTVAVRTTEAAQAKSFAHSGVHYAMGMLADPATLQGTLANAPGDAAAFSNVTVPGDAKRGGGRFSLLYPADTFAGTGDSRYQVKAGALDESGRWNVNALIAADPTGKVLYDALMKLPNMTEDVANAIVDYVDPDDSVRESGAESSEYAGRTPPYRAKNGPLNSVDELLYVRGVTPDLLFGTDRNRNGRLDADEAAGGELTRGWADFLTVYGREINVDSAGGARVNLDDDLLTPAEMYQKLYDRLGQEPADYIMAVRLYGQAAVPTTTTSTNTTTAMSINPATGAVSGTTTRVTVNTVTNTGGSSGGSTVTGTPQQLREAVQASLSAANARLSKKVAKIANLQNTQVTLPKPANAADDAPTVVVPSPFNDKAKLADGLPKLMDGFTVGIEYELAPRLNVNAAAPEVLAGLPGLTEAEVSSIVSARSNLAPTDLATTTGAWLVTAANLPMAKYTAIEKYVTGRTMTYRLHSLGYFAQGGPVARVEAVIDTNLGHPRILYFRDLSDLGRGFELPR